MLSHPCTQGSLWVTLSPWSRSRLKQWDLHAASWSQGTWPSQGPKPCTAQRVGNRPSLVLDESGARIGKLESTDGEQRCGRGMGVLEEEGPAGQTRRFHTPLPTVSPPWSVVLPCRTQQVGRDKGITAQPYELCNDDLP